MAVLVLKGRPARGDRWHYLKHLLATAMLSSIALAGVRAAEQPRELDVYQVKAAFLYNFVKFVQWPPSTDTSGYLVIAVIGDDPFGDLIDRIVRGKTIQGRELVVRRLGGDAELRSCHIVFISPSEARRTPEIVARAQAAGVLTVGETPHFLRDGGVIRFFVEGQRVRFQINTTGAEQAKLKISSQLLSLAEK